MQGYDLRDVAMPAIEHLHSTYRRPADVLGWNEMDFQMGNLDTVLGVLREKGFDCIVERHCRGQNNARECLMAASVFLWPCDLGKWTSFMAFDRYDFQFGGDRLFVVFRQARHARLFSTVLQETLEED